MICLATEDDIESIRAIERDAAKRFSAAGFADLEASEGWPSEAVRDHVRAGRAWVALDAHGARCGFVLAWSGDGMAIVCELGVARSSARQGYGRDLMRTVHEWAREQSLASVGLATLRDVPWNVPFYESLGFRVVGDAERVAWMTRQFEREARESPVLAARRVFMVRVA